MDHDKEDGEMSDEIVDEMDVDDKQPDSNNSEDKSTLIYKADKTGPIVKQLTRVDAQKLEDRAKRFNLNLSGNRAVTQKQIDELYTNIGIEGNERHFKLDTLHLTGIDGLNTKDVFEYLEDYKPVSLEWIDGTSCNVVCQDHIAAALALLVHSREISDEDLTNMLAERSTHHWREGMPHPKKDVILMRFATNGDKKISKKQHETKYKSSDPNEKNPWGDLCKSWGVYDHQEIFQRKLPYTNENYDDDDNYEEIQPRKIIKPRNKNLAMRLGKRSHKVEVSEESSDSDAEWKTKSKVPRMRMRADDEESKIKKVVAKAHNSSDEEEYAPLSIEIINSKNSYVPRKSKSSLVSEKFKKHETLNPNRTVQSRLGIKVVPNEDRSFSDSCSDDPDYITMSRVQKVKSQSTKTSSVWERLERTHGQSRNSSDLRQILKTRKHKPADDLRERLGKSKSNLRIEIDNNYASE